MTDMQSRREGSSIVIPLLLELAKKKAAAKGKPRAALVAPSEPVTLGAFMKAVEQELIDPFLIGDEYLAKGYLESVGYRGSLDELKFLDIREPELAAKTAFRMAVEGELDLLVKGKVPTAEFLALMFDKSLEFVTPDKLVSHVAIIKVDGYHKLLFLTDAAVNVDLTLPRKIGLIENAMKVAGRVGVERPKVAVLAAVEVVYPQMPITTDGAILAKMSDRGQIKAIVDGPLSFDTAVDRVAAEFKGVGASLVAGDVDILLAPNIETANGVYKAMSLYGNASVGGVVFGGHVPIAISSRCDAEDNRLNSILLGLIAS